MRFERHADGEYFRDHNEITLLNYDTGVVYFNSTKDYDDAFAGSIQASIFVDLCVPDGPYQVILSDKKGDGYRGTGATFQIDVNGKPVKKVEQVSFTKQVIGLNGAPNIGKDGASGAMVPVFHTLWLVILSSFLFLVD